MEKKNGLSFRNLALRMNFARWTKTFFFSTLQFLRIEIFSFKTFLYNDVYYTWLYCIEKKIVKNILVQTFLHCVQWKTKWYT